MNRKHLLKTIGLSILKMLAVIAACMGLAFLASRFGIGKESVLMIFLVGVLLVTILTDGYVFGLVAAFVSVMLFNYFFTEPLYTFVIGSPGDVILLAFFLLTAAVSGTVTLRLRKQKEVSSQNEQTARKLYEVSKSFLHVTGEQNIITQGLKFIEENTGCPALVVSDKGKKKDERGDVEDVSQGSGNAFPIGGAPSRFGILNVSAEKGALTPSQEILVKTVAAQMGLALEREHSYAEREEIRIAMERERLRSTLLRSIAHDLRSPLTALTGASTLLSENFTELSDTEKAKLASDISEEMVWLSNLVENILNMTRIGEGNLVLRREEEVVDDVVNEALTHMSRVLKEKKLTVSLPDSVVTLPMDGRLIVQVIVNLLDNAVRHTREGSEIALEVAAVRDGARFSVCDNGEGIAKDKLAKLFEAPAEPRRSVADGRRGIGLGLVICREIVRAHGGSIKAENRPSGGACFSFFLPSEVK